MTELSEFSPEMASDPNTSPHDMARMAAERPDLWAALAANPAIYPDLRDWLGQIDDPVVHEALQASAHRTSVIQAPAERDGYDGDFPSTHLADDDHSKALDVAAGPGIATVFRQQPFDAATSQPPVPSGSVPPPPSPAPVPSGSVPPPPSPAPVPSGSVPPPRPRHRFRLAVFPRPRPRHRFRLAAFPRPRPRHRFRLAAFPRPRIRSIANTTGGNGHRLLLFSRWSLR